MKLHMDYDVRGLTLTSGGESYRVYAEAEVFPNKHGSGIYLKRIDNDAPQDMYNITKMLK